MEEIIIFSEEFHQSIEDLVEILFVKNYFGFEEDCQNYGDRIYDFVINNIILPTSKISPENFQKYGKKYLRTMLTTKHHVIFSLSKRSPVSR